MLFLTVCVIEYFSQVSGRLDTKRAHNKKRAGQTAASVSGRPVSDLHVYPFPAGFFPDQSTDFAKYVRRLSPAGLELLFLG